MRSDVSYSFLSAAFFLLCMSGSAQPAPMSHSANGDHRPLGVNDYTFSCRDANGHSASYRSGDCQSQQISGAVELSHVGLSTDRSNAASNLAKIEAAAQDANNRGVAVHGYHATVPVSGEIVWPAHVDFYADGMTFTADGATGPFPDGAVFYVAGHATDLGSLSDQTDARSTQFTLSSTPPPFLGSGSLIFLVDKAHSSFSSSRPYYYAGEAALVQGVSGRTITLATRLRYRYPVATTKVSVIDPATVQIDGLSVQGVSSASGVTPIVVRFGGPQLILKSVYGFQSDYAGILVREGYGLKVIGSRANTSGSKLTGTNYGIMLANVSGVEIVGGNYVGQRHGVAIGGSDDDYAITSFNSGATKATIETTPQVNPVVAADMHGNCDSCFYIDNTIRGGLEFGGVNNRISGNRITVGTTYNISQFCILVSELLGLDNHVNHNTCDIRSNTLNPIYAAGIDIDTSSGGLGASTTMGGTLDFSNNTFNYYLATGKSPLVYILTGNIASATAYPLNIDLSGSTFHMVGGDAGVQANGVAIYSTHKGQHWTNLNLSNVSGDVSFDLRGVDNVTANNFRANDMSGAAFSPSVVPLSVIDARGNVEITNFQGAGGHSSAIRVLGSNSAIVNMNGIYTAPSKFGLTTVVVNSVAREGAGAAVKLSNFHLLGKNGAANIVAGRFEVGQGETGEGLKVKTGTVRRAVP